MNQLDRGFAQRADEDVQKVLANGHRNQKLIVTNGGSREPLQSFFFMAIQGFFRFAVALGTGLLAWSHPMGNFSVNRHARFEARPSGVQLTYVLELAEQPAFELIEGWGLNAERDRGAVEKRAADEAGAWAGGLKVSLNGAPAGVRFERAEAHVREGVGGLPVLRVSMRGWMDGTGGTVEYHDTNFAGRAGWSEVVVAAGPGARVEASTHTAEDRSSALTSFSGVAPRDVRARFRWSEGAGAGRAMELLPKDGGAGVATGDAGGAREADAPRHDYLSGLLGGRELTPSMLAAGLCVAFGLGAMHALSPGHGKTIVAAYLVGSRGTLKHAILLGGLVTFTHTVSVFALGLGVLWFENYIAPDRVIPVLGAISGLSIVAIGAWLLYRRAMPLLARNFHEHGIARHHHALGLRGHHHHHDHADHGHSHMPEGEVTLGGLIALGISGGLVPCPSALVLLLSSIALGRVALGLGLLAAFSAGLAAVLIAIGVAVLYAKHLLPERARADSPAFRYVPVFTAGVVVVLGLVMTGVSLGWIRPVLAG